MRTAGMNKEVSAVSFYFAYEAKKASIKAGEQGYSLLSRFASVCGKVS